MDDLISRQAVIYTICDELDKIDHVPQWVYDRLEKALKQLPSAQPELKRGKWIHDGSKWTNRWICSECGYKWFFDCIEGAYCPNCGADMREVTT